MKEEIDELDTEDTYEETIVYDGNGEVVEIAKRGRPKGFTKDIGYIIIDKKLRVRVEVDNLILEEKIGEDGWGNNRYYTSWDGLLNSLIRRYSTEKISKLGAISFVDAKKEILVAIDEVKELLLGEINNSKKSASEEIKNLIEKYNK